MPMPERLPASSDAAADRPRFANPATAAFAAAYAAPAADRAAPTATPTTVASVNRFVAVGARSAAAPTPPAPTSTGWAARFPALVATPATLAVERQEDGGPRPVSCSYGVKLGAGMVGGVALFAAFCWAADYCRTRHNDVGAGSCAIGAVATLLIMALFGARAVTKYARALPDAPPSLV